MAVSKPTQYELWSAVEPLVQWPVSDEDSWHNRGSGWQQGHTAFLTASDSAPNVDDRLATGWTDQAGVEYRTKAAALYGSARAVSQQMQHAQYLANAYADDVAYTKTSISNLIRDNEPAYQSMTKFIFWPDNNARNKLAHQLATAINQFIDLMADRIAARGTSGSELPRPQFVKGSPTNEDTVVPPGTVRGLDPSEQATLDRMKADPRFKDRDLRPSSAERNGEYIDKVGKTYDQMGDPRNSLYWNEDNFFRSIDRHLNKSMDYTVIDLTGYTKEQIAAVGNYLNSLPPDKLAKIIRIGF